jgi:hypothetical protein
LVIVNALDSSAIYPDAAGCSCLGLDAKHLQRPGTPPRSRGPRSVDVRFDPATRSLTGCETSTSLGGAVATTRRSSRHGEAADLVVVRQTMRTVDAVFSGR